MKNLVPSLYIFYGMLIGQGILYTIAGILEIFSFVLRRSLARQAGFSGPQGVEYVNSYYAYVFNKCMKGAVLAPEKTSLITFAVDSLNSDSPKKQLSGLKMLHKVLKKEIFRTKAISELTTSTNTVACLVNILGWTSERDKDVRLFATKVFAELADNLRIVSVPGAMQLIGSLLDTAHKSKERDPLGIDSPEPKQDNLIQQIGGNEQSSRVIKWLKKTAKYCLIPRDEPCNMDEPKPHIFRFWKQSDAKEEPSKDQDLLPVLGMLILDKLASFDLENCIEICRDPGLTTKVIEFTSNRPNMTYSNETHKTLLKRSSLKLLCRLAKTKGKIGVTLRQNILEHPFLLSNLVEILDNNDSSHELRELTTELIKNIAMEENIKEEIGRIPVIISRLMDAFLSQSALSRTDSAQLLQMTSGQALAVLAMESANNCLIMLAEPHSFIKELTVMIHGDRYRYVASSLLQNMCVHVRPELGSSDLKEISYILREVLEGIMDAEGTELEVLVGLSSQICNVIPVDFARELEHGQIKERFMKRLVDALNSNMIPTAHCPGIRRAIVEHTICMMECNPEYASCFKECWMMEALLMVERTPSRAEKYRFFSGDAGLMEHNVPISALVARAKELMGRG
ncbi:uncharacterized protein LOC119360705 [Triticum dicoccoides]|uniref:uncharacterized protein LOC119360705 n=1 Tax=Triticum dicoccoides TaxID=85692 RepID=UPI00188FA75F|nr:uncharacterized protein LOC119360705 [Triticum dicoccoides]